MKRIAIMQPYFFPYIGYFQLMAAVDEFVVYDKIKYTKKGWINRNRILSGGSDSYITLPLKSDSDFLNIDERTLSVTWEKDRIKLKNRISAEYVKAPFYSSIMPLVESCLYFDDSNLFRFLINSLTVVKDYLGIATPLTISSEIEIDPGVRYLDRIIAIAKERKADMYINPIGGLELYSKEDFASKGISLAFLKTGDIRYEQFSNEFVPFLSIIDVMMFNSIERIEEYLVDGYTLL